MRRYLKVLPAILFLILSCAREDVLTIGDFEDGTFGEWRVEGEAFGEVFVDDGRYYLPLGTYLVDKDPAVKVYSENGNTRLNEFEVYELSSVWE